MLSINQIFYNLFLPKRKNKLVLNKKSCLKQQQRRQRLNSLFSNRKFESFSRFKAKHNRSSLKFQKSSNTFYFRTETFSLSAKNFSLRADTVFYFKWIVSGRRNRDGKTIRLDQPDPSPTWRNRRSLFAELAGVPQKKCSVPRWAELRPERLSRQIGRARCRWQTARRRHRVGITRTTMMKTRRRAQTRQAWKCRLLKLFSPIRSDIGDSSSPID